MRRVLFAAAFGLLLNGVATGQTGPTLTAVGDEVVLRTSARGVQIYECRAVAGGSPAWAFLEPRADLFVGEHPVGKHFAGPTWEHSDGSRIVGKVVANLPAPDVGAIPWPFKITGRDSTGPLESTRASPASPASAVILGMKWEDAGASNVQILNDSGQLHRVTDFRALTLKQRSR